MNFQQNPYNYNEKQERVIPFLTGVVLGNVFPRPFGGIGAANIYPYPVQPYPIYQPYPYQPYPYQPYPPQYPGYRPRRNRRFFN